MGVGQELTNGLKGVAHVFSFMLKQKNPPHINKNRSLSYSNGVMLFSTNRKNLLSRRLTFNQF